MKKYILTLFAVITLPAVLTARPWNNGPCGGSFFGGGGGGIMWITGLLLIIALVFFIYTAAKNKKLSGEFLSSDSREEEPLAILKKRLAKGEISEDDYERLREKLS